MATFAWRPGARLNGTDPSIAALELERIRKAAGGSLNPDAVIDESKPTDAPLHNEFVWDNAQAGQEWRRHQARYIIKSLVIVSDDKNEPPEPVYVHVKTPTTSAYENVRTIMVSAPNKFQIALLEAQRDLKVATNRVRVLQRLGAEMGINEGTQFKVNEAGDHLEVAVETLSDLDDEDGAGSPV